MTGVASGNVKWMVEQFMDALQRMNALQHREIAIPAPTGNANTAPHGENS